MRMAQIWEKDKWASTLPRLPNNSAQLTGGRAPPTIRQHIAEHGVLRCQEQVAKSYLTSLLGISSLILSCIGILTACDMWCMATNL